MLWERQSVPKTDKQKGKVIYFEHPEKKRNWFGEFSSVPSSTGWVGGVLMHSCFLLLWFWSCCGHSLLGLCSRGLQISGSREREMSAPVEVSHFAIEKFSASTPVCLTGSASTHWGGKQKEFCFCYLLVWDYWEVISATQGLKGLIKVTSLHRACDVTILRGRTRNENHSFSIVFLLNVSIWQERGIRVGVFFHLESSGDPKLGRESARSLFIFHKGLSWSKIGIIPAAFS